MNTNIQTIIKMLCIVISLILLSILCFLVLSYNKAKKEDFKTPVQITPVKENVKPQEPQKIYPTVTPKPVTRDENNVPKSDYKVPEIG